MKIDQHNKDVSILLKTFLALKNKKEAWKFLRDLLTEAEIKEFANRWKVARMLNKKISYEEIGKATGMSSTTIASVNRWLTNGKGGYRLVLKKFENKNF